MCYERQKLVFSIVTGNGWYLKVWWISGADHYYNILKIHDFFLFQVVASENNSGLRNELCASNCSGLSLFFFPLLFKVILKTKFSLRCKSHWSTPEQYTSYALVSMEMFTKHAIETDKSFIADLKGWRIRPSSAIYSWRSIKTECFCWSFRNYGNEGLVNILNIPESW